MHKLRPVPTAPKPETETQIFRRLTRHLKDAGRKKLRMAKPIRAEDRRND